MRHAYFCAGAVAPNKAQIKVGEMSMMQFVVALAWPLVVLIAVAVFSVPLWRILGELFIAEGDSVKSVRQYFTEKWGGKQDFDIVFVTQCGSSNESLKGVVTVWDVVNK